MRFHIERSALLLGLVIALDASAAALPTPSNPSNTCKPVKYRVVKTQWDFDSKEGVYKSIVIPLQDFAPDRLLCLVKSLELEYQNSNSVDIDIFSSVAAARTCLPNIPLPENGYPYCRQRHAMYMFNARTQQRLIELLPMGSGINVAESTTVNLPATTLRPCRLEIEHRCILDMQVPYYSDNAIGALISARVVVAVTVDRRGKVSEITIRSAAAHDSRGRRTSVEAFVRDVVESLRSWQFEESTRQTNFPMVFQFEITDELSELSLDVTQFPRRIVLRGKPSLLRYK